MRNGTKEGEIVAVTGPRLEYRRNGETEEPAPRTHKLDQDTAKIFLAALDKGSRLQGIDATKTMLNATARDRAEERRDIRLEKATQIDDWPLNRVVVKDKVPAVIGRAAIKVPGAALDVLAKPLDLLANVFEGFFAPALTPEQIRQGEIATQRRQAEGENGIDFRKYTADMAQQRQQQENEQEAQRRRQREVDRDR